MQSHSRRVMVVLSFAICVALGTVAALVIVHRAANHDWTNGEAADHLAVMLRAHDSDLTRTSDDYDRGDRSAFAIDCTALGRDAIDAANQITAGKWPRHARYAADQLVRTLRTEAHDLDGCAANGISDFTSPVGAENALQAELGTGNQPLSITVWSTRGR